MDTLQDSSWKDTHPPVNLQKGLVICTIFWKNNNEILLDIMLSKYVFNGIVVQIMSELVTASSNFYIYKFLKIPLQIYYLFGVYFLWKEK